MNIAPAGRAGLLRQRRLHVLVATSERPTIRPELDILIMGDEPELSATITWCSRKYGLNSYVHEIGFEAGSLTARQTSVDAKSLTHSARMQLEPLGRVVDFSDQSYKKECQEKNLPHRLNTAPFLSRHSAPLLERALLTESGLPQAEPFVSSPRAKRRYASPPLWVSFRYRDGAHRF